MLKASNIFWGVGFKLVLCFRWGVWCRNAGAHSKWWTCDRSAGVSCRPYRPETGIQLWFAVKNMLQHYLLQKLSSVVLITAWIVSGLYKPVYLASFFHASAVQTREATAAERKNTVQRLLRVQQREGSPALESRPQHQQRSRRRRVLWTRTIEYLTVHLQPQSTLRHLYTLFFIIIELNQAPGRLTPNITTVCSLYLFVLFFRIL